ncbi:unnamed protein product [Tuber melanosporum]|uniref:(Perigord truffle) hypothetical protein n=1 Tax=Tuber melanosporum (strain Mel28) TaxID=656061 RepID=D5GC87_TUBMM|nr:uncharacterized protein GSTUM_00000639001 [Tuber melanosporum]CAZ82130.1 unnamed protein product [Tuber melanosporum]
MFRPLPLWKSIPCPAIKSGSACSLPHCLFSHSMVPAPAIISSLSSPALPSTQSPAKKEASPSSSPRPPTVPTPTPVQPNVSIAKDPRIIASARNAAPPSANRKRRMATGDEDSYASSSSDGGVPLGTGPAPPAPKKIKTDAARAGSAAPIAPKPKSILRAHAKVNSQTPSSTFKPNAQAQNSPKPKTHSKARAEDTSKSVPVPRGAGGASAQTTAQPSATGSTASGAPKAGIAKPATSGKPLSLNPRLVAAAPATHDIRLRLLTLLHKEYVRLHEHKGDEQLMLRYALDEEETLAVHKKPIYTHAMKKRILQMSKTTPEEYRKSLEAEKAKQQMKSGDENMAPALSTGKTIPEELNALRPLINSPNKLQTYGYILDPPTEKEIKLSLDGLKSAGGWEQCDRCTTRFQVYQGRREVDGQLASGGKCIFHWGRLIFLQRTGSAYQDNAREKVYSCCRRVAGGPGCTTAENHVFKVSEAKRLAASWPFTRTPPPPNPTAGSPPTDSPESKDSPPTLVEKAICLDCEMCYTTRGMELIRITATAFPTGAIVMDSLVRPFGEILDLNTRFSGVHPLEFTSAQPFTPQPYPTTTTLINPCSPAPSTPLCIIPSPSAARDLLLTYIDSETPLIGHALENDLNALRLCHKNIIDTAILFPHSRGTPARNKLKYLADVHLGRRIQVEGAADGHDSAVDARCAGELVRYKIGGGLSMR